MNHRAILGILSVLIFNSLETGIASGGERANLVLTSAKSGIPALDSGLWRTEFGHQVPGGGRTHSETGFADLTDRTGKLFNVDSGVAGQMEGLVEMAAGPLANLVSFDGIRSDGASFDSAVNDLTVGSKSTDESVPLSDWDQASISAGHADPFANYAGPSLTTYLVAFVAVVVVVGAVLSPRS